MTTVAFYTEAGSKRGMGHLVRCYTLFQYFQKHSINAEFFLDSDKDYCESFQEINPFKWDELKYDMVYDVIFIDSYVADISVYEKLFERSKLLVSIDDYDRLDYPAGIIINFAPDAQKLFFKNKKSDTTYLLGLDYIPIREEFQDVAVEKKEQIFIMLGGNDIYNLSENILNAIEDITVSKVIVVNDENTAKKLANDTHTKVLYKPTVQELTHQMSRSSLAISTASMSLYELSYFQIPTIIIATSKNQQDGVKQLLRHQIANRYVDTNSTDWKTQLFIETKTLLSSPIIKKQLVDAEGSKRIFTTVKERVNI